MYDKTIGPRDGVEMKERDKTDFEVALHALADEIDCLDKTIAGLIDRLNVACGEEDSRRAEQEDPTPSPGTSPIVVALYAQFQNCRDIRRAVQSVYDRLEI